MTASKLQRPIDLLERREIKLIVETLIVDVIREVAPSDLTKEEERSSDSDDDLVDKADVAAARFPADVQVAPAPAAMALVFTKSKSTEANADADALVGRSVLVKWASVGWCWGGGDPPQHGRRSAQG